MNARYSHRRSTEGAFTFVEVLAAMLFLAILVPTVVEGLMIANRAAITAERTETAAQLAENRLSELVMADEWRGSENRGDFGQDWPGFRWEASQEDWEGGDMVQLTVHVLFQIQGQEQEVSVSTLVSESLTTEAQTAL